MVNGRLQFADIPLQKGSLDLAVFGRNLFDRKYRTFGIDFGAALGWAVNTYGDPRTFGLQTDLQLHGGRSRAAATGSGGPGRSAASAAGEEEDRAAQRALRLRQGDAEGRGQADPG